MKKSWPWHPLLFAAFPVLNLLQQNTEYATFGQAVVPLGIIVGAAALLLAIGTPIWKDARRAALVVSLATLLFFSYGYVADAVEDWTIGGLAIGSNRYLLAVWAIVGLAAAFLLLRVRRSLPETTKILNIVAAVLVLTAAVPVGLDALRGDETENLADDSTLPAAGSSAAGGKRDIFFVIFDRYGGEDALKEYFAYDNGPFLDSLEKRGFNVARDARSNYPNTAHSLAASFNMRYLDNLARSPGPNSADWKPVYAMLGRHTVGRFLKDQGYRFVNIGSRWDPTRSNPLADRNVIFDPFSEFSRTLLDTTPLGPVSRGLGFGEDKLDPRMVEWRRIQFQFEQLARAGNDGKPTFVFAHFLLPHHPYVFDRTGKFLSEETTQRRGWRRSYVEQLVYANTMMTRTVDRILASPDPDPIIILASDEGPPPGTDPDNPGDTGDSWATKSTRQLRQKFGILAAFYLPGVTDPKIPQTISQVNFFRKVLSLYFGADLPLLTDESFVWEDTRHLYRFLRVTDRVAG